MEAIFPTGTNPVPVCKDHAAEPHHAENSTAYPYTLLDFPRTHTTTKMKKCGTGIILKRSHQIEEFHTNRLHDNLREDDRA